MYPIDLLKDKSEIDLDWYKKMIENYLNEKFNNSRFEINANEDKLGVKLRVELDNFLIFQVHLQHKIEGISSEILDKTIDSSSVSKDHLLKIPPMKYELIYRFYEALNNSRKGWHLDYIKEHKRDIDNKLLKEAFPDVCRIKKINEYLDCISKHES